MLYDERPVEREQLDQEEVWSAIRYLDPDERDKDRKANPATIIGVSSLSDVERSDEFCLLSKQLVAGGGCTGPNCCPRAAWVNGQISPMISVQMLILFLMFITFGKESSHFRETSGPWEARHTCRSQPRCMHLGRPQTRS